MGCGVQRRGQGHGRPCALPQTLLHAEHRVCGDRTRGARLPALSSSSWWQVQETLQAILGGPGAAHLATGWASPCGGWGSS